MFQSKTYYFYIVMVAAYGFMLAMDDFKKEALDSVRLAQGDSRAIDRLTDFSDVIIIDDIKNAWESPQGSGSYTAVLANGDTLHADCCPKTGQISCVRSVYNPHGAEIIIPVSSHYFHVLKKIVQEKIVKDKNVKK